MGDIVPDAIEHYLHSLLPPRDPVLAEMEAYAAAHQVPIVGPAVGGLLALLVKLSGAQRIFEMGSAIGYSTIWLARAAGEGAEIYYSDGDEQNAARARDYSHRAGVADRVRILVGNSLDLLQETSGDFDIIFCDVDKHYYPQVFPLATPRIRRGGLLIADNVLWHGRVVRPARPDDRETRAILEWGRLVSRDPRLLTTIVPLRDGVSVSWKL
jgi:predicted O-methyltransferase YrrM